MLHPTTLRSLHARSALRSAIMLVTGFAACGIVPLAKAQTLALSKGTEVRVVIPASGAGPQRQILGRLVRLQNDTVVIWTGGLARPESVSLVLDRGRRLEALAARHGHGGAGAAVGAIVGALTGAAIGSATWRACTAQGPLACFMHPSQGEQAAAGALLGTVGGALLGLVIGHSIASDAWVPVDTADIRVAVIPRALGISIRF